MQKLYLFLLSVLFSLSLVAQTVSWNFGTTAANASPSSGTPITNVTVSDVTQGNNNGTTPLLSTTSPSSGYTGASGQFNAGAAARTGVITTAASGSAYFEFTLTPSNGKADTINAISFGSRSTSTGPQAYVVRTSLDNFANNVTTGTLPNTSTWTLYNNSSLSIIGAANTAVTVRIYGYAGTGSASANTANWRIDDLSIVIPSNTSTPTAPTVSIAAGVNAAEPSTNGSFIVTLSQAAPTGGVTVAYTLSGTATQGVDYSDPQNGSLSIAAGATTGTININVIDDNLAEGTETIIATINSVTGSYTIGTGSATINLLDDGDAAVVTPISYTGATYMQDFNTLAISGTSSTLPNGWLLSESGTNANSTYAADGGSSNSGNTYSYGTGTATERAFGGLRSGSLVPTIGAIFRNNTGAVLSTVVVNYTGEQWRIGAAGRADRLDFQYSTDATSLTTGTWTNLDALDFTGPNTSAVGAVDGNATGNNRAITFTITGLSIPNGATFLFRWTDFDASGGDDGLSVDNFSLSPGCTPPTNQPTGLTFTPGLQQIQGSFTNAVTGVVNPDRYLVVISSSPTLTEQPSAGTTYALDDAIGGGKVVAITDGTNSNAFTASELSPGTTYYFFVYSFTAASNCYNITNPLTASQATNTPPPCAPPATQVSTINANPLTATAITLNYTRGSGDNILIIARRGDPIRSEPINSLSYVTGSTTGSGDTVIYNGTAASFTYSGLMQNTTYYFALYEYASAANCYLKPAATANFTTACSTPANVTSLVAGAGNALANVSWTNPTASCFDEVLVVVSGSAISNDGSTYSGTANTTYTGAGAPQVVYRGVGSNATVTGLANGTTYFVKVFTRLGGIYSGVVQVSVLPFDPASGYTYLFGNFHAHSSYSDGNKDNTANSPDEDFVFARDALCMDYMGMSEHNHSGAGMMISNFHRGYGEANSVNGVPGPGGNSIVTLWGIEWGVISGGGHVLTYGFDSTLLGWEAGNYDIFVAKNDYASLFTTVNSRPGAVNMLAHPNSTDFGNLASGYSTSADNAIVGCAIESGPAFSTATSYNDPPTRLGYLSYFRTLLSRGYHLAPDMDMDNHNLTFGRANANRTVVLAAARSREAIMEALRNSRFYASQDCNLRIDYKQGNNPMGSTVASAGAPVLTLNATDIDGEGITTIELWGGEAGNNTVPAAPIKTYGGDPNNSVSGFTFNASNAENTQPNNTTYYYYAIITEADGDKAVTAPIWYNRNETILPVSLLSFNSVYSDRDKSVHLNWSTVQEVNSKSFIVERSADGQHFTDIGTVAASGNSQNVQQYQLTDRQPLAGTSYYRLRQVDADSRATFSRVVKINTDGKAVFALYPNPAKSVAYLYSNSTISEKVTVQVLDNLGREVSQQVRTINAATPVALDVSRLRIGSYFVKISSSTSSTTERLLVQ